MGKSSSFPAAEVLLPLNTSDSTSSRKKKPYKNPKVVLRPPPLEINTTDASINSTGVTGFHTLPPTPLPNSPMSSVAKDAKKLEETKQALSSENSMCSCFSSLFKKKPLLDLDNWDKTNSRPNSEPVKGKTR